MRKKDFNFVLEKDNVFEFEKRFNRLLMLTGCLESQSFYKWKNNPNKILTSIGIKRDILNITETVKSYFVNGKVEFDTFPSQVKLHSDECRGIIIRLHADSCWVIYFGQKMKFTPLELIVFGHGREKDPFFKIGSSECRLKPFSNIEKAKYKIEQDERLAREYWDSLDYQDY